MIVPRGIRTQPKDTKNGAPRDRAGCPVYCERVLQSRNYAFIIPITSAEFIGVENIGKS